MIKRIFYSFGLMILLFNLIFSCKKKQKPIDISGINIEAPLFRFDELLTNKEQITAEDWQSIAQNHAQFSQVFFDAVLGTENKTVASVQQFQAYFDSTGVNKMVSDNYTQLPEYDEFVKMQKRMKAMFSAYQPVGLTTMISGFNYKNMMLDKELAVGLEMYLGDQIDYTQIGNVVNDYQIHRFHRNYILPDAATAMVDDFFEDKGEYNTFLKRIIYEGKKLYVKQQLLPQATPEKLIGLTPEAYQWCVDNEQTIWQYFISKELLYNNDIHRWKTYVFDGPFSAGMPEEAPALTGNFIGWQIIKSYLAENKDVNISELLVNEDAASILKGAKYAP